MAQLVERSLPNTRGPRFESSHRQNLYLTLFTVNSIEKTKQEKRGQKWPIFTTIRDDFSHRGRFEFKTTMAR